MKKIVSDLMERWCKNYIYKWLHVEREPPEGWIQYCLYKIYFRWRVPSFKAIRRVYKGPKRFRVVGKTTIFLRSIDFTHSVSNDFTDRKLRKRIDTLRQLPEQKHFSEMELQQLLPSINNIRVLICGDRYKLCDGHGRVFAMMQTHPECSLEVDIIQPVEQERSCNVPSIGELRIKRKFASLPVQCKFNGTLWLQTYFSLEQYSESVEGYDPTEEWIVVARVSEKDVPLVSLMTDPDATMRNFAQMIFSIKRGREALVSAEE